MAERDDEKELKVHEVFRTSKDDKELTERLVELGFSETWFTGTHQKNKGISRKYVAEAFLALFPDDYRQEMEHEFEQLHGLKAYSRFRAALISLLISTYENGMRHAREDNAFDLVEHLKSLDPISIETARRLARGR